ncbi:MAG: hypothetical protein CMB99_01225 [Flavobacteriaceae bacterium]|nr:hypothetical protein [Flavobacteriaceae bacterium]
MSPAEPTEPIGHVGDQASDVFFVGDRHEDVVGIARRDGVHAPRPVLGVLTNDPQAGRGAGEGELGLPVVSDGGLDRTGAGDGDDGSHGVTPTEQGVGVVPGCRYSRRWARVPRARAVAWSPTPSPCGRTSWGAGRRSPPRTPVGRVHGAERWRSDGGGQERPRSHRPWLRWTGTP